jgi:hypothetical protein
MNNFFQFAADITYCFWFNLIHIVFVWESDSCRRWFQFKRFYETLTSLIMYHICITEFALYIEQLIHSSKFHPARTVHSLRHLTFLPLKSWFMHISTVIRSTCCSVIYGRLHTHTITVLHATLRRDTQNFCFQQDAPSAKRFC